jgi:hypothetical protein
MEISTAKVVEKYLGQTHLTLRKFADELCQGLTDDDDVTLTHSTILNWREGRTVPGTDLLTLILLRHNDWRFNFALECLVTKRPEVWSADGIWKLAAEMILPVAG